MIRPPTAQAQSSETGAETGRVGGVGGEGGEVDNEYKEADKCSALSPVESRPGF